MTNQKKGNELEVIKQGITKMSGQFGLVLPLGISENRFTRVLQTAISNNLQLQTVSRESLFSAAMASAEAGLLPDGKEAAIVPIAGKAVFIPMVKGLVKKMYSCEKVEFVSAQVICENDEFNFMFSEDGEKFSHNITGLNRGTPIGVYAYAKFKGGGAIIEVMAKDEIEAVKTAVKSKNGPWSSAFEPEMWRKSALKRLSKRLPLTNISDEFNEVPSVDSPEKDYKLELEEIPPE